MGFRRGESYFEERGQGKWRARYRLNPSTAERFFEAHAGNERVYYDGILVGVRITTAEYVGLTADQVREAIDRRVFGIMTPYCEVEECIRRLERDPKFGTFDGEDACHDALLAMLVRSPGYSTMTADQLRWETGERMEMIIKTPTGYEMVYLNDRDLTLETDGYQDLVWDEDTGQFEGPGAERFLKQRNSIKDMQRGCDNH